MPLLKQLRDRGLTLVILSGTEQEWLQSEAELLRLAPFFGRHIYGSTTDLIASSKQAVISRLLVEEKIVGEHLLSFGDGPVEIEFTKQVAGYLGVNPSEVLAWVEGRAEPAINLFLRLVDLIERSTVSAARTATVLRSKRDEK